MVFFGKINQPELQLLGKSPGLTKSKSQDETDVALRGESDPHHPGHFLGVTDLQIPSFCNSKFQAAVMNLTRRRMFGSIHLRFFWCRAGNSGL